MSSQPLPSSFDEENEHQETILQKVTRKLREEPLIPLGTGLTCLALYNATRAMRRGDHAGVQRMFRARIGAQAFTVIAMVAGGAYYGADREKRKELIKLEAQKRAEERNQKWLHELEVRDEEDKKLQAAIQRKRDRQEKRLAERGDRERERETDGTTTSTSTVAAAKEAVSGAKPDSGANGQETNTGSSVLSALSGVGGWFGTKKESPPPEQNKTDTETPKK
ncbi:mitochondrial hypoxia responsive domain-containing protein [Xylaria sp. CBS 124048]|nr:mitochondrial hypoxia responsive domain-containing protein [Xylaria sp. CBS 124048]